VEDDEQVVRVLVDLRPLTPREDVLDVERMPAEALREGLGLLLAGGVGVDPREPVRGELGEPRLRLRDDLRAAARA
jgi:hypothetical protein